MRVFVSVGTQKFQFNRLLEKADYLAEANPTYEIFAQSGYSDYVPQHYKSVDFLQKCEYEKEIEKCDLLLTHGGVATIMSGLSKKKAIIAVPRLARYDEHVDDHQIEIVESFAEMRYVLRLNENDNLTDMVKKSCEFSFAVYQSHNETVLTTIKSYLQTIDL